MRPYSLSFVTDRRSACGSPASAPSRRTRRSKNASAIERAISILFAALRYLLIAAVVVVVLISLVPRDRSGRASLGRGESVSEEFPYEYSEEEYDPTKEEANGDNEMPYEAYIDLYVRNADQDQPLLQYIDNAMPQDEFDQIQTCLRDHPMRHSNVNDDSTFKGTKGFLMSFSEKGVKQFTEHPSFKCLAPYFRTHMLPNANAWVLNMVWAEIPDYTREFAIQRHTDDAIVVEFAGSKKIMPYQTNVLYVFVPDDMVGGELEAWPYEITYADVARGPEGRVRPLENRMAFFRGDAQHQVRSYNTSSKSVLRGSLVLEQYSVPEEYQHLVTEFHWRDNNGSEMM